MRERAIVSYEAAARLIAVALLTAACGKRDSGNTTGVGGNTVTVASQLTVTTQASASAASAATFAVQPVVQLRDGTGNAVSQAGVVVTASIASGGGTLGGTTTATTNSTGAASFTDLSIAGIIGTRTLTFTSTSPALSVTSAAIAISAGAASQLSIITQPPATVVTGALLGAQPAIQLVDRFGNAVSLASTAINVSIGTGTGTLTGTLTIVTNASGVATYTDLGLIGAGGTVTLNFSAVGFPTVSSSAVAITALPLPSLAGTWSGTWVDTRYGVSGTITNVVLTQTATTFGGTGTIDLSSLGLGSQNGTATGTISGNTVTFNFTAAGIGSGSGILNTTVASGSGSITALNFGSFGFTGTASSTQITGTFQFTSPTGGNGTITVTKH